VNRIIEIKYVVIITTKTYVGAFNLILRNSKAGVLGKMCVRAYFLDPNMNWALSINWV
jgi:hypothetical protein